MISRADINLLFFFAGVTFSGLPSFYPRYLSSVNDPSSFPVIKKNVWTWLNRRITRWKCTIFTGHTRVVSTLLSHVTLYLPNWYRPRFSKKPRRATQFSRWACYLCRCTGNHSGVRPIAFYMKYTSSYNIDMEKENLSAQAIYPRRTCVAYATIY